MKLSKLREAIRKIIESEGKNVRVCPSCGHHNSKDATKCLNCGYEPLTKDHDKIIEEGLYEQIKKYVCPPATQDDELNKKNRNATKKDHLYGPMNEEPSKYWPKIASKWNVSITEAKTRRCGNCVAYDQSPRMKKCMKTKDSNLGYCWMHHFKCQAARSCDTWAPNGPLKTDKESYKWQDKSPFQGDKNENN